MTVYYDSNGNVLIEFAGAALELSREEAEQLFVDLGFVLQDMDMIEKGNEEANSTDVLQA